MHGELRFSHQWKDTLILRCVPPINGLVCFHLSSLLASTQSLASFINASFVVKLASSLYVKTLISARLRRPRNFFSGLCVGSIVCVSGLTCLSLIFFINSYFYWSIFRDLWRSE